MISSDKHRAIMSANSFLASLYPPTGPYVFQQGLNWQAFPVHTISPSLDYYIHGTDCPALDQVLDRLYSSPNYTLYLKENQDFIYQVCQNAGYPPDQRTLENLKHVCDNLFCDKVHNFSIPSWVTDDVWIRIQNVVNREKELKYGDQESNYLEAGGGPLLGLMLENMFNKKAKNLTQKFIYYSGHDTTVLPFLGILNQPTADIPPYASCAFLELHQTSNDRYQVQLLFLNTTEGQMQQPRMIPGCDALKCDLDAFADIVQSKINMDPKTACYDVTDLR